MKMSLNEQLTASYYNVMVNTLNNHVVQEGQQQDAKCGVIMCKGVTV